VTAAVAVGARRSGPVNAGFAATSLAVAVLLVAGQEQVRHVEAVVCAVLLRLFAIAPAESLGTAVTFPSKGSYVGFTVAPGCTAALLIVPFVVVAGLLLLAGRVSPGRAVATVGVFAGVVVAVNQMRLIAIAIAMRAWGYPDGFERSHVLMGSLVSTIGVAGGLLLFLRMIVPRESRKRRRAQDG
jgi:exosortase/archaeosortase family protein